MPNTFSPDNAGPPTRFRPGPGQTGAAAGQQALKPKRGGGGGAQGKRTAGSAASPALGLPSLEQAPQPEPDLTGPAMLVARWKNAVRLGRDIPFGAWLIRSGEANQLLKPGQQAFDVFAGDDEYLGSAAQP